MSTKNSKVITRIREMILNGELQPGQRLREAELAKTLGVSRTPVREALPMLAEEGVLQQLDTRGFVVREFGTQEIRDAIEVRGALEGLAARMLAEQGVPRRLMQSLQECLNEGDGIFAKGHIVEADETRYREMNTRFHALIVQGCGSKVIADALERNGRVPFASSHAIAFDRVDLRGMFNGLWYVHRQHHAIFEALEHGEGERAGALMVEHAYSAKEISVIVAGRHWRPRTQLLAPSADGASQDGKAT